MRKMRKDNKISPVALTIAGSDSGGGAGIQADLKTFAHFGVFGTSAITAITAQNPCEVRRIDPLPPASVKAQAEAVFAKFAVKAVKTGMLFNAQIISATIEILRKNPSVIYVADPVMIATSGAVLLRPDAIEKLKSGLLPLADWVTPNIPEAEILSGMKITGVSDMRKAALICSEKWNCGCIVKGGHLEKGKLRTDVVAFKGNIYSLESPAAGKKSLHGTGCSFSAAITASLAVVHNWRSALILAKSYIYGSILESVSPGEGFLSLNPPSKDYSGLVSMKECHSHLTG